MGGLISLKRHTWKRTRDLGDGMLWLLLAAGLSSIQWKWGVEAVALCFYFSYLFYLLSYHLHNHSFRSWQRNGNSMTCSFVDGDFGGEVEEHWYRVVHTGPSEAAAPEEVPPPPLDYFDLWFLHSPTKVHSFSLLLSSSSPSAKSQQQCKAAMKEELQKFSWTCKWSELLQVAKPAVGAVNNRREGSFAAGKSPQRLSLYFILLKIVEGNSEPKGKCWNAKAMNRCRAEEEEKEEGDWIRNK